MSVSEYGITGWGQEADEHLAANPAAYASLASFIADLCMGIEAGCPPEKVCADLMEFGALEEPVSTWLAARTRS